MWNTRPMAVLTGLYLMLGSLLYGYCLAAQPERTTAGARRVADWTYRQHVAVRIGVAFVAWLAFMTGLRLFAINVG